jgi:bifunctional UDP-N-acetylglucosamine pyrophosphorylase/glucosamine-1-phosphate N-acetyltransferase
MTKTVILLAAGLGTRMKSSLPKAAHPIAGRPMLAHLIATAKQVFDRIAVVVGPDMPLLESIASPYPSVIQTERLGTGHAALSAAAHFGDGEVAILFADNPLITAETLRHLLAARQAPGVGLALMAMRPKNPARYGRLVLNGNYVERIVEYKDASIDERAISLCNAGALCGQAHEILAWLKRITNDNAAGEYYLTDLVQLANADGRFVVAVEADEDELRGINSRAELAEAETVMQTRLRQEAMENGVTLIAPDTVFFSTDTVLAADTMVHPHVVFGPGVVLDGPAEIKSFCHLENCRVGAGSIIGPYARLRPGTVLGQNVHIGNFVELKATTMGDGAKANHLTYLGDASVGPGTNIGAGSITCNYDGYQKHRTTIGANVFLGSDTVLVAPITIGDGAFTAAGSTVTKDVAEGAMAFGRARETHFSGRAEKFHAEQKRLKAEGHT